jgi:NAD(P)-dependent dehydrogenase (short-subunit alcohol dehydrogenase family)
MTSNIYTYVLTHHLKVLINNAGIARIPSSLTDFRTAYDITFSTNITSVALLTTAFLPLLHASPSPKVINISSARGSLTRSTEGQLPPTMAVAYSVSKTALNGLTIEFQKTEDARGETVSGGRVKFYAVSPGHLKTAFNNFRGKKDPLDGAEVVVRLVCEEGEREGGTFWEFEGGEMREVPW